MHIATGKTRQTSLPFRRNEVFFNTRSMSRTQQNKRRRSERLQNENSLQLSRVEPQYTHALECFETNDGRGWGVRATQRIPKRFAEDG